MNLSLLVCLLLPTGIGLVILGGIRGLRRAGGSARARGRILAAEPRGSPGGEGPVDSISLRFEYSFGGQRYEGQQVVRSWLFRVGGNVVNFLDRYRPGREVSVRYDPAHPNLAQVDVGWTWSGAPLLLVGGAFILIALVPNTWGHIWVRLLFGIWILAGLTMIAVGMGDIRQASVVRRWRTTYGIVVSSEVVQSVGADEEGSVWWPEVQYEYEVGGQRLRGRQIQATTASLSGNRGAAQKLAARYPVGERVRVAFDPADPTSAALAKGTSRGWLLLVVGGLATLVAACALLGYLAV